MLVRQILSLKSDAAATPRGSTVVTISPDATVAQATELLAQRRIGAVVVTADGSRPDGILSERDIVRELGRRGAEVLQSRVGDVMTGKIATCRTGDDALVVLSRMTEGRFRHLPVVDDDGRMIGLVSIGDAVSGRLKELAAENEALESMIMGV